MAPPPGLPLALYKPAMLAGERSPGRADSRSAPLLALRARCAAGGRGGAGVECGRVLHWQLRVPCAPHLLRPCPGACACSRARLLSAAAAAECAFPTASQRPALCGRASLLLAFAPASTYLAPSMAPRPLPPCHQSPSSPTPPQSEVAVKLELFPSDTVAEADIKGALQRNNIINFIRSQTQTLPWWTGAAARGAGRQAVAGCWRKPGGARRDRAWQRGRHPTLQLAGPWQGGDAAKSGLEGCVGRSLPSLQCRYALPAAGTVCAANESCTCTGASVTPAKVITNCPIDVCYLMDGSGSINREPCLVASSCACCNQGRASYCDWAWCT